MSTFRMIGGRQTREVVRSGSTIKLFVDHEHVARVIEEKARIAHKAERSAFFESIAA